MFDIFVQFVIFLSSTSLNQVSASYSWFSDNPELYGQHILELVLAGSHKACAYDSDFEVSTQSLDLSSQFGKGTRFFDIPLEYFSDGDIPSAYYCERGFTDSTGVRANTEVSDGAAGYIEALATVLDIYEGEIIFVYWRMGAYAGDPTNIATLLSNIEAELGEFAVSNTADLSSITAQDVIDSGKQLIMFSETGFLSSEFIFDADTYLNFQVSLDAGDYDAIYSTAFQAVDNGFGQGEFMALQWYIGEDTTTAMGEWNDSLAAVAKSDVNSMLGDFITDLESALPRMIGNTILVDFVQYSDILDLVTRLNTAYMDCSDDYSRRGNEAGSCKWLYDEGLCLAEIFWGVCPRTCDAGLEMGIDLDPARCSANELSGMYRDICNASSPCENPDAGCFELPTYAEKYYINSFSWCEAPEPFQTCAEFDAALMRAMTVGICMDTAAISIDYAELENCDKCSDNAQCESGYCWPGVGVCTTPGYDIDLINFNSTYVQEGYSNLVYSTNAKKFRDYIAQFRSKGDPDALPDSEDIEDGIDGIQDAPINLIPIFKETNVAYFDSLWSCAGIPFVIAVVLLMLYLFILFFRCCCGIFCNNCCRHKPSPPESRSRAWCSMISALIISLIVGGFSISCYFQMEEMVTNVIGDDRLLDVVSGLVNDTIEQVQNVENSLMSLRDSVSDVFDATDVLVSATSAFQDQIDNVETEYDNFLAETYDNVSYTSTNGDLVTFVCLFCEAKNELLGSLDFQPMFDLLRDISVEVAAADNELVDNRDVVLDALQDAIDQLEENVNIDELSFEENKDEIREVTENLHGPKIFLAPCIFFIVGILALFFSWDCWFVIGWLSAMLLSVLFMFLLGVLSFGGMVWADLCVKLDSAELGIGTSGFDFTQFMQEDVDQDFVDIFDCCLEDCRLLDLDIMGNVSMDVDFAVYQDAIHEQNRYKVIKMTEFEEWRYLVAQVEMLDTSTFYPLVDGGLIQMNEYVCSGTLDITENPITRDNLADVLVDLNDGNGEYSYCPGTSSATVLAYGDNLEEMITEEANKTSEFDDVVAVALGSAEALINSVNTLTDFLQNMKSSLEEIECLLNPLVYDVEVLMDGDTARCGFVGERYGEIKQIFCQDLFSNMSYICLGVMVIAIGSIFIFNEYIRLQRRWNYTDEPYDNDSQKPAAQGEDSGDYEGRRNGGHSVYEPAPPKYVEEYEVEMQTQEGARYDTY